MKLPLFSLALIAATAAAAQPVFTLPKSYPLPQASVTIGWDASPTNQNVTSYNLYQGDKTRAYTNWTPTTSTAITVPVVRGSTNFFAVTAVASNGLESGFSSELVYIAPGVPSSPTNVIKVSVVVQGSPDLQKWINLATGPTLLFTNPPDPMMAFRSMLSITEIPQ